MSARQATDRVALTTRRDLLGDARERGDTRPAPTLLAVCLNELGVTLPERQVTVSLDEARDEWMQRLRSANRSASGLAAYRTALNDLIDFLARGQHTNGVISEQTIVAYLDEYRERSRRRRPPTTDASPCCATSSAG